jgi:hypothetical protein
LLRRNEAARVDIIQGMRDTLAVDKANTGIKQQQEIPIFFTIYLLIVVVQAIVPTILILLTVSWPAILYFVFNCTCDIIINGCPLPTDPPYCRRARLYLLLVFNAGILTLQLFLGLFLVLSFPVALIAIALDGIGGLFTRRWSIASESESTNDLRSTLDVLTEVQDSFSELKCQLELIQCQIKDAYIELKSMLEK